MERSGKNLAFLDTHVVIWLYDALASKFSKKTIDVINKCDLFISPLVLLEIEYLFEVKKIKDKPSPILASLQSSIGLKVSNTPLDKIIDVAVTLDWTRDPFDRILVAESYINNAYFISKDKHIRKNYNLSVW
ncbi:hypothetical protein A2954_00980 [Candidatus Roizmanbacteria bacterium RIFCSPLOWO2_01_FULL_37_12]|uniref:PIN domain-containing protein n=1 Tax=Candidatus Roizmanbacteria bacterium RIFCSPLOWO2_01_FULL_37_12 TaxID=1802056 RepID=A0A1F7IGC2_9BACT|nr:MAG: hypothetical protein A3D76_00205 [Candidatus Roizmanbacteria bacterium RIFCSPHIGHO2_02_FULL_37_9b]OGK42401.1 MAG: hypothetical protein A2954_00980 [Candidatus Roizmanbacteria bacterium RIFCSPLOWO2_01_FULL_37_12]